MKRRFPQLRFALAALLAAAPVGAREFFENEPINYSTAVSNDPVARLARDWEQGRNLITAREPLAFLRELLAKLEVPEESQVLVFSETSHQNHLISPRTPRALYFSDDVYVGYVQGGSIELIACDPVIGPVFYLLDRPGQGGTPTVEREASCLSCHATARTENVPGMLVRSVIPDADGRPILRMGSDLTTHASPLGERWGGWYVTGTHEGVRHMGNVTAREEDPRLDTEAGANWTTLEGKIDTSRYLRPTSDIVALMVLEHQCRMHNLITKAGMSYRRALWLLKTLRPDADESETDSSAHRVAESAAEDIVREMLFVDEAEPGPVGVEGDRAFQRAFARNAPTSETGRSLKDFRLYGRIFKHRCSYMIYSDAFAAQPEKIRDLVYARLRDILLDGGGGETFADLGDSERRKIAAILDDTHAVWRGDDA
jgi:hypothetical protein